MEFALQEILLTVPILVKWALDRIAFGTKHEVAKTDMAFSFVAPQMKGVATHLPKPWVYRLSIALRVVFSLALFLLFAATLAAWIGTYEPGTDPDMRPVLVIFILEVAWLAFHSISVQEFPTCSRERMSYALRLTRPAGKGDGELEMRTVILEAFPPAQILAVDGDGLSSLRLLGRTRRKAITVYVECRRVPTGDYTLLILANHSGTVMVRWRAIRDVAHRLADKVLGVKTAKPALPETSTPGRLRRNILTMGQRAFSGAR